MKIKELFENKIPRQLPWQGNVQIGWWQDNKVMRMYHGTNLDFVPSIAKEGLNRLDASTGMISFAYEPFTARAFAVMGGKHDS
jgi:RNA:NAD 2'-phosphotransferase (TPT1/KptA family)